MRRSLLLILTVFTLGQFSLAQNVNQKYRVVNLDINTKGSDYGAILFQDSLVVFTSEQRNSGRRINKSVNNVPFTDIYVATRNDSQVVDSRLLRENFMSRFNESDATFTPDGKTAFFTSNNLVGKKRARQDDRGSVNLEILVTRQDEKGNWSEPAPLDFIQEMFSYAHPSVSEDGTKLFFASNMPGSLGKSDIFFVSLNKTGQYGAPINAGYNVNTPDIENYPYQDFSGNLYFSSDRYGGKGGLDIYRAQASSNGLFEVPDLMREPVNSEADDFAFKLYEKSDMGFFSSNREGGKGGDDIYMFYQSCDILLKGIVQEKMLLDTILDASVYLYDSDSVLIDSAFVSADKIEYTFKVGCESEYQLRPQKNLFDGNTLALSTKGVEESEIYNPLLMAPIINEKMVIMIGPIYFDFNESEIRPTVDGKDEMDRIVELMQANPSMVVEVASYTDSRGDTTYNQQLSQARADSTVNYIVKAGIDSARIYGKGYGEKNLVNNCADGVDCTPEEHQLNRRTEFKVVSMEGEEFEQVIRTNEAYRKEEEDKEN